jgi:hypothetical protein
VNKSCSVCSALAAYAFAMVGTVSSRADCDTNSSVYKVCATWTSGDPLSGTDYVVNFNDPNPPPDIELITGNDTWTIYVQNAAGTAPADLGALTTSAGANFTVKILGPGSTPGAVDVDGIDLQPTGNFRSALANGSRISGDLELSTSSGNSMRR